ncbi:MAG: PTS glucose transporter subunit IIA [Lachnospiraceae bacterium]
MGFLDKLLKKESQTVQDKTSDSNHHAEPMKETIYAFVSGELVDIKKVPDEMFAAEMLGKSVAIEPTDNVIKAPCKGTVITVFDTKHAIGISTEQGVELLLHIGINTVDLKGEYFQVFVKEGDIVEAGQKIAEVDMDQVREKGYPAVTMLIITNSDDYKDFNVTEPQIVEGTEVVMTVLK